MLRATSLILKPNLKIRYNVSIVAVYGCNYDIYPNCQYGNEKKLWALIEIASQLHRFWGWRQPALTDAGNSARPVPLAGRLYGLLLRRTLLCAR